MFASILKKLYNANGAGWMKAGVAPNSFNFDNISLTISLRTATSPTFSSIPGMPPPIPGADLPHVVQAWDVLSGKAKVGQHVVIIGGGAVGVETALELAEQGTLSSDALKFLLVHGAADLDELQSLATRGTRKVVLLEMLGKLGANFGKTTRWVMLDDLKRYGVDAMTEAKALQINSDSLSSCTAPSHQ